MDLMSNHRLVFIIPIQHVKKQRCVIRRCIFKNMLSINDISLPIIFFLPSAQLLRSKHAPNEVREDALTFEKELMAVFMTVCTHVPSNLYLSCKLCFGYMFFGSTWWSLDKTTIKPQKKSSYSCSAFYRHPSDEVTSLKHSSSRNLKFTHKKRSFLRFYKTPMCICTAPSHRNHSAQPQP